MLKLAGKVTLFLVKGLKLKLDRIVDWLSLAAKCPRSSSLPLGVTIIGRDITLGMNTILEEGVLIEISGLKSGFEKISIGSYCEIRYGAQIRSWLGKVSIGDHCSINSNTLLYGTGGIDIGNYVRIAANCILVASNHEFRDWSKPICRQGYTAKGITIEDDVWIGAGVCILDGVTIRRGSVIGAGAVVKDSTPPFSVSVGIPATVIKLRC